MNAIFFFRLIIFRLISFKYNHFSFTFAVLSFDLLVNNNHTFFFVCHSKRRLFKHCDEIFNFCLIVKRGKNLIKHQTKL